MAKHRVLRTSLIFYMLSVSCAFQLNMCDRSSLVDEIKLFVFARCILGNGEVQLFDRPQVLGREIMPEKLLSCNLHSCTNFVDGSSL